MVAVVFFSPMYEYFHRKLLERGIRNGRRNSAAGDS